MYTKRPRARFDREVYMKVKDPTVLRTARTRAGYTQYDLAALAKCKQPTISALETGVMPSCSKDLAETLAKWLDRSVEELFTEHAGSRVHRVTNASGSKRRPAALVAA